MKSVPKMKFARKQTVQGFSLLELVVVVSILVILAGALLPKFDLFKQKADEGVAASGMTDVSRIIQTFFAQNAVYPDHWDSLMVSATALWDDADKTSDGEELEPQLTGTSGPASASPRRLIVGTALSANEARSLSRIGITTIIDVDQTTVGLLPNDHFNASANSPKRTINTGTVLAQLNYLGSTADDGAKAIVNHIYPNQVDPTNPVPPTGKRLVVLGFGSQSTAVGNIVQQVPFYPNVDQTKYYSRYLCIFEVDSAGARADLMEVIGADGDQSSDEIGNYYQKL